MSNLLFSIEVHEIINIIYFFEIMIKKFSDNRLKIISDILGILLYKVTKIISLLKRLKSGYKLQT